MTNHIITGPRFGRVTPTFLFPVFRWLMVSVLLFVALAPLQARADDVEISSVGIESTEEGYKLASSFSFDMPRGLEDVIMRGIPLYFTTEVELTHPRWYWFDEKAISTSRTVRISYDVLTRRYHASSSGRLQQSFGTLEDAVSLVRRPGRWLIAERGALKIGEVYRVAVRMGLDVGRLPKPFQIHALNSSDWRFSSGWKEFNYRAD